MKTTLILLVALITPFISIAQLRYFGRVPLKTPIKSYTITAKHSNTTTQLKIDSALYNEKGEQVFRQYLDDRYGFPNRYDKPKQERYVYKDNVIYEYTASTYHIDRLIQNYSINNSTDEEEEEVGDMEILADYTPPKNVVKLKTKTLDEKGNVVKEVHYTSQGEVNTSFERHYDKRSNMLIVRRYFANGKLMSEDVYTYDAKGNMLEKVSKYRSYHGMAFRPPIVTRYTYDKDNKISEAKTLIMDTLNSHSRYHKIITDTSVVSEVENVFTGVRRKVAEDIERNRGRVKVEKKYSENGDIWMHQIHTFNKKGLLVKQQLLNKENKVYNTITYTYDKKGNCIELVVSETLKLNHGDRVEVHKSTKTYIRKIVY